MSNHNPSSRFEKRDKRRKTNFVLNTLITIVVLLIVVIGSQLVLGGNEKTAKYNEPPEINLENEESNSSNQVKEDNPEIDPESVTEENVEAQSEETEKVEISEGEPGSGVEEIIENPSWSPIGTSQSEPHSANYTRGSQDWNEMTKAISYATGIPESEMIIWFLGNNGSPNDAVGTISPKDKSAKYKVYITWVENKGWKPTKIEKVQ